METQWDSAIVPDDKRPIYVSLRKLIRTGFRKLTPKDANTIKRDVILIHRDGHAGKWVFVGYDEYLANIGCVGKTFAEIHIPSSGLNIRTAYDNGYILIKDNK